MLFSFLIQFNIFFLTFPVISSLSLGYLKICSIPYGLCMERKRGGRDPKGLAERLEGRKCPPGVGEPERSGAPEQACSPRPVRREALQTAWGDGKWTRRHWVWGAVQAGDMTLGSLQGMCGIEVTELNEVTGGVSGDSKEKAHESKNRGFMQDTSVMLSTLRHLELDLQGQKPI